MAHEDLISNISTYELLPLLDGGESTLYLLDVREPDEVADWHIAGAHNIPLGSLEARFSEVPREKEIVTVCAKGTRALEASGVLASHGVTAGRSVTCLTRTCTPITSAARENWRPKAVPRYG